MPTPRLQLPSFEDYRATFALVPLHTSEQSETFIVHGSDGKRVCKHYHTPLERAREEVAWRFINSQRLLEIPELLGVGSDYLELEFVERCGECTIEEIIRGVSQLYTACSTCKPDIFFPTIDLSQAKMLHRLSYVAVEMEKRGVRDPELLKTVEQFVKCDYTPSPHRTLVHGDLKSPHVIPTHNGIKFIDLELVSVASPWYDLAFLVLTHHEKVQAIDRVANAADATLGGHFQLELKEIRHFLKSATAYRAFYNLGFALRHRTERTIKRTISELRDVLSA